MNSTVWFRGKGRARRQPRAAPWRVPCLVLLALFIFSAPAVTQDLNIIRVGTGSTAGTYFPVGGLIANAISNPPGSRPCDRGGSCGVPGLIAVAQSTAGSVENIRAVDGGVMEMALSQADVAYWAYYGTGSFEGDARRSSLRALANLFPENIHLVARANSGIETLADLKGKTISIGGPLSGSQIDAKLIMSAFKIRFEDLKMVDLDIEESTDALVTGDIDAFFYVSGAPALAISDLAERVPLHFVPIAGPIAEKLVKIFPFFVPGVIPAGVYGDNPETPTLDVGAIMVVSAEMDESLAYGIPRAIWHPNTAAMYATGHPRAALMSLDRATRGIGFRLHRGAVRYYAEQGTLPAPADGQDEAADAPLAIR